MNVKYDDFFDFIAGDEKSRVFEAFPPVYGDSRGFFCEVFKSETGWPELKQINRSVSVPYTVRGCHAQKAPFCQSKFVQALNVPIYDVIADGRPDSKTFGRVKAYLLDPNRQSMLFVPRGFLHAFCTPAGSGNAIFEYFCDNVYDKKSETGVNPMSVVPDCAKDLAGNPEFAPFADIFNDVAKLQLSEKDMAAPTFAEWSDAVCGEYRRSGKLWYR